MKNNKKIFILFLFILSSFTLNANLNDILNSKKNYQIYSGNNNEKTFNAVRYINNNYSKEKEIVGLTIAEHMPRVEIMMKNILDSLPLIK